jgi:hypothetical protein
LIKSINAALTIFGVDERKQSVAIGRRNARNISQADSRTAFKGRRRSRNKKASTIKERGKESQFESLSFSEDKKKKGKV